MDNSLINRPLMFKDNSYIDKMFCYYCKRCPKCWYDKHLCDKCGKYIFSDDSINVKTNTIPTRYGYSYYHWPSHMPQVWFYGSYQRDSINMPRILKK